MTTVSVEKEIVVHCNEGNSDKLYRVRIERDDAGTYGVHCENCRRGAAWADQGYKAQGVTLAEADKKAASVIKSKLAKGYLPYSEWPVGDGSAPAPSPTATVLANADLAGPALRVQLLNLIDEVEAEDYINSPEWAMEQKHDGERRPIRKEQDSLTGYNKKGAPTSLDGPIAKEMAALGHDGIVDGEQVGNHYYAFDLLEFNGVDLRSKPYLYRRSQLDLFLKGANPSVVEIVPFVTDPQQKRDDLAYLRKAGAEGVVFKRLKAAHSAGRPNSGGDQLKLKFYEMASVIVMALTKGKRSVEMGVVKAPAVHPKAALMPAKFQVDGVVPIGSVTIPANHEIPAVGSVCEVRYLYTYPTGSMFQTTYLRPRTDVDPEECHAAQLKFRVASEDDEG